jgi:hypothetical protein
MMEIINAREYADELLFCHEKKQQQKKTKWEHVKIEKIGK